MNRDAELMLAHLGIECGRMLDLGAGDAVGDSSVGLPFIEAGWDVVLVDASPACVEVLAKKFGRHPKVKVVSALVVADGVDGFRPFYEIPSDLSLSTASEALMNRKIGREVFDTIHMEPADPVDLWDDFGPFDVISVDLEGESLGVAYRLMESERGGKALCVEVFPSEVFGTNEADKLRETASHHGYKVLAHLKENMILVKA